MADPNLVKNHRIANDHSDEKVRGNTVQQSGGTTVVVYSFSKLRLYMFQLEEQLREVGNKTNQLPCGLHEHTIRPS